MSAEQLALKAALEHSIARQAYKRAFREYVKTLEPLEDEHFWGLLDHLRKLLLQRGIRGQALKRAVDEFFRLPSFWSGCQRGTCGGGEDPGYTTVDAIRFAKTYAEKAGVLYQPLFETVEDRGDDSYSDLLDCLVLLGKDLHAKCVGDGRSDFGNMRAFVAAVNEACAGYASSAEQAEAFSKFVLHGENYVEMRLLEEAERRFVFYACDLER